MNQPEIWTDEGRVKMANSIRQQCEEIASKIESGELLFDGLNYEAEVFQKFPSGGSRLFGLTGRNILTVKVWRKPQ